jgi:hypothetical protein
MTTTTTCPPLADRITRSLLGYGVIAGPVYVIAVAAQAVTREGFDSARHAASQLANGDFGWIQSATFIVTGAMTVAAAAGVGRALSRRSSVWASSLIAMSGAGLVLAGFFRADPSDGFPPGTPLGMVEPTWHGMAHFAVAGIGFMCLVAACFLVAAHFEQERGWAWFSRVTGVFVAATFVFMASGSGGAVAILLFTAAVVLAWAWLSAISAKLYRTVGAT